MRRIKRLVASTGIAALALAVTPLVSLASPVEADMSQGIREFPHTVSTSGAPHMAALLNVGTQQSVLMRQTFARTGEVEVAGVQLSEGGIELPHSVSTSGSPMIAAMLNAGTSHSVAIRSGQVLP